MTQISYRSYQLDKPLIVNGREFSTLTISSHYEKKHGSYMNDNLIEKIVDQLDKKEFTPKFHKQITNEPNDYWQSFSYEPLFYNGKAYCLV